MNRSGGLLCLVALLCLLLSSCATMRPGYEEPTVALNSFKALPSEGMTPSFEIGLTVLNPNPEPLNIQGIVYTVSVAGHDLVKGVGKDFPVIEGYSEGQLNLFATTKLLSAIRLITDLMQQQEQQKALEYRFEAKLDMGGLYPSVRIAETGEFRLDGSRPAE